MYTLTRTVHKFLNIPYILESLRSESPSRTLIKINKNDTYYSSYYIIVLYFIVTIKKYKPEIYLDVSLRSV